MLTATDSTSRSHPPARGSGEPAPRAARRPSSPAIRRPTRSLDAASSSASSTLRAQWISSSVGANASLTGATWTGERQVLPLNPSWAAHSAALPRAVEVAIVEMGRVDAVDARRAVPRGCTGSSDTESRGSRRCGRGGSRTRRSCPRFRARARSSGGLRWRSPRPCSGPLIRSITAAIRMWRSPGPFPRSASSRSAATALISRGPETFGIRNACGPPRRAPRCRPAPRRWSGG